MPHTLERQSLADGPAISPLAGKPAPKELLVDVARLETRVLRSQARCKRAQPASCLWHERTPWVVAARCFQRSAHPGDYASDLRVPQRARDRRSFIYG